MGKGFSIFKIGVAGQPEKTFRKIWMINILAGIAAVNCSFYIASYLFLGYWVSAMINTMALVLYELTFFWNYKKQFRLARNWIFSIFIVHLMILTLFEFSKHTGFHFYYFIVPALSFLLFEYEEKIDRFLLSGVAFALFLISELWTSHVPYFELSSGANRFFYISSVVIVFLIILTVIIFFTNYLNQHEENREKLISELQKALSEVKTLKGFLPICSSCKKIRDDKGYWNRIESYISKHSEAEFTHGMCPECNDKFYGNEAWYIKLNKQGEKR